MLGPFAHMAPFGLIAPPLPLKKILATPLPLDGLHDPQTVYEALMGCRGLWRSEGPSSDLRGPQDRLQNRLSDSMKLFVGLSSRDPHGLLAPQFQLFFYFFLIFFFKFIWAPSKK